MRRVEPAAVRVGGVRRGRAAAVEEARLGREVVLHRAVEVEVVLRQVRERRRREAHAVDPVQLERVRRHLHRAGPVAGVEHPPERPLQVDRLGRRPLDRLGDAADALLDRAEQPAACRPPPRGSRASRRRSWSCRSCRSRRPRAASGSGSPKKRSASGAIAAARVGHDRLRHGHVERPLGDERDGAGRDRRGRVVVAVDDARRARTRTARRAATRRESYATSATSTASRRPTTVRTSSVSSSRSSSTGGVYCRRRPGMAGRPRTAGSPTAEVDSHRPG